MSNTGLDAVNNNSTVGQIMSDLSSGSLQMMFAALQLEMSESAKTQAMDRMKAIKETQEEQKFVSALIQEARQLQSNAKDQCGKVQYVTYYTYTTNEKGEEVRSNPKMESMAANCNVTLMSEPMVKYMDQHKLAYDNNGNNHGHTAEEWNVAIKSLEAHLEQLGTETQQQMVFIQDFMGQYNSYLQGAMTQISESNRTTSALAKGQ